MGRGRRELQAEPTGTVYHSCVCLCLGRGRVFSVVKEHLCVCLWDSNCCILCVHVHCLVNAHHDYVGRGDNMLCQTQIYAFSFLWAKVENVNVSHLVWVHYVTMIVNYVNRAEIGLFLSDRLDLKKALESAFDRQPVHMSTLNASPLNEHPAHRFTVMFPSAVSFLLCFLCFLSWVFLHCIKEVTAVYSLLLFSATTICHFWISSMWGSLPAFGWNASFNSAQFAGKYIE